MLLMPTPMINAVMSKSKPRVGGSLSANMPTKVLGPHALSHRQYPAQHPQTDGAALGLGNASSEEKSLPISMGRR